MLSQLYIENIAVIQKATIQLDHGFNVFTGETGEIGRASCRERV